MLPNSTGQFVIDVMRSMPPGNLCFLPVMTAESGEAGVNNDLAVYGEAPPVPDAEILGYIFDGPMDLLERWEAANAPWLDKLNIRKHN